MLTEKQEAILDFIRSVQAEQGIPPSTRQIQRQFGYSSQNAAMNHLRALSKKGHLHQNEGGTWGLRAKEVQAHLFELPIYGVIPAGVPTMNDQQPKERIAFNPAIFRVKRRFDDRRAYPRWGYRGARAARSEGGGYCGGVGG